MYTGTFSSQYRFKPGELVLCGQSVQSIEWSTVLGKCDDTLSDLIHSLPKHSSQYNYPQIISYLRDTLSSPLSICTLSIQTNSNTLELHFQEEKTLRFALSDGNSYLYRVNAPVSPTFLIAADVIADIMEAALSLLSATTPQQMNNQLEKLDIFCTGCTLIPITK